MDWIIFGQVSRDRANKNRTTEHLIYITALIADCIILNVLGVIQSIHWRKCRMRLVQLWYVQDVVGEYCMQKVIIQWEAVEILLKYIT